MRVLKRIKNEKGEFLVDCEFSEIEMNIIMEVGLNEMLKLGAIPFTMVNQKDAAKYAPGGQG